MKVLLVVAILFLIKLSETKSASLNQIEREPTKQQFPRCSKGQEFRRCGPPCPQTCEYLLYPCQRQENSTCRPGCYCPDGYIKTPNGECKSGTYACCPPNEVHSSCGSPCQTTCKNYWQTCPLQTFACTNACYCIEGFARNRFGKCIPIEYCPREPYDPICPRRNEYFDKCTRDCEKSCDNPNFSCLQDQCLAKCICRNGFVRDHMQNCIPANQCPRIDESCTNPNEFFNNCAKKCEATCDKPLPACSNECVQKCVCRDGYTRDKKNQCIRVEQCPENNSGTEPVCTGVNEFFNPCAKKCQATCDNAYVACTNDCNALCVCRQGFVRDANNVCIPENECPNFNSHLCATNEEYQECGTACQPTCATPDIPCPKKAICDFGCRCKKGFVRQYLNGPCIELKKCSVTPNQQRCLKPNEEFRNCSSPCEPTCHKPVIADFCEIMPCAEGCFCKEGFIRDVDDNCILLAQCSD